MPKKPKEIPLHEQVILEPEMEEALKNATDAEMCDIAGSTEFIINFIRFEAQNKANTNPDFCPTQLLKITITLVLYHLRCCFGLNDLLISAKSFFFKLVYFALP